MRLRRSVLGLNQKELGERTGVTFQQIQKYERGANRIGASRLFQMARALDVPIAYFFEGLDPTGKSLSNKDEREALYDFIASPDGLDLASAFADIEDQAVRRRVIDLLRSLASQG